MCRLNSKKKTTFLIPFVLGTLLGLMICGGGLASYISYWIQPCSGPVSPLAAVELFQAVGLELVNVKEIDCYPSPLCRRAYGLAASLHYEEEVFHLYIMKFVNRESSSQAVRDINEMDQNTKGGHYRAFYLDTLVVSIHPSDKEVTQMLQEILEEATQSSAFYK